MTRHPMGHVRKDCRGLGAVVVVVGRGGAAAAAGDAGGVGDE